MIRDLESAECRILDQLHDRSIDTAAIPGPILEPLLALGLVEVTWAGRARLTGDGRALFDVVSSA